MKVIIAGSRGITDYATVLEAICGSGFAITEVVSGAAHGVDTLGEQWAAAQQPPIPVKRFPAQWVRFGRSAGYRHNLRMARYADALIAIWDGQSPGTRHMIDTAQAEGLQTYVSRLGKEALP